MEEMDVIAPEVGEQMPELGDTHNQMSFLLFDAIALEAFAGKPTSMGGRSAGNTFAHGKHLWLEWIQGLRA